MRKVTAVVVAFALAVLGLTLTTAAYVNDQRKLIAGPASNVRTGAPAEVLPADEGR